MYKNNKSIRIIKRTHRESRADQVEFSVPLKTENQTRREILKTIKAWIAEQQETKQAQQRRVGF